LDLPRDEYASFYGEDGRWYPKPLAELTPQQQYEVTKGKYRCRPIHPTQLYASANALLLAGLLYGIWRKSRVERGTPDGRFWRPGLTVWLAFILYGITRLLLESVRDDNPFEFDSLTVSQIGGILLFVFGVILLAAHVLIKPHNAGGSNPSRRAENPRQAPKAKPAGHD
ncbi:MAG: prolipoprotein diacylglyceryl transferase, partial [Sedimentisphaerales bacterium]|nr:prolipoprotein diacylglyceryl transferase [Sedimentisphaerales bacterium]